MKKLTAEELQSKLETFYGYIDQYISEPRKSKLKQFYSDREDQQVLISTQTDPSDPNTFSFLTQNGPPPGSPSFLTIPQTRIGR